MLQLAIVLITSALIFYSIGVWSEKIQGTLKVWHTVMFFIGLFFDTTGTLTMEAIAKANHVSTVTSGFNLHNFTGLAAILLMLIHAIWATFVLYKKDAKQSKQFHKFSLFVWCIWLIPFISGAISKMF
jgi:uncharacterized repeat protein (TIGR03987 family)